MRGHGAEIKQDCIFCDAPYQRWIALAEFSQKFIGSELAMMKRNREALQRGTRRGAAADDAFRFNDRAVNAF